MNREASGERPICLQRSALVSIVATALALSGAVMLIRGRIVGALHKSALVEDPIGSALTTLAASFHDLVFILCGVAVFMSASLMWTNRPGHQRRLPRMFFALSLGLLAVYIAHISVMKFLFKPFTYQWLYYSDFLGSFDAHQAIAANMNGEMIAVACALVILFLMGRWVLDRVLARTFDARHPLVLPGALVAAGIAVIVVSGSQLIAKNIPYSQTAQPIVAFVASLPIGSGGVIHSADASTDVSDFLPREQRPQQVRLATSNTEGAARSARPAVRNVIFYVMESVAAEYVGLYGSTLGATPELDRRRNESLIVSDAYAHSPTTTMSMVSLLTATYPWVTQRLVTSEYPDIDLTSISSLLKAQGYSTGFFYAADLRFQKSGEFLRHRHFDRVHDYRSMPCDTAPSVTNTKGSFSTLFWDYLDGIKDDCAVGALSDWLGEVASGPFFAVLWTHMTHYPYMLASAETCFPVRDKDQNRYLNALRSGDQGLGRLLRQLDALGLADSTLVVVLGDHGEAFGRHGDRGHGSAIYDANIKIPLVFINRQLFHGETVDTVGGIADIAPTVSQLIGIGQGNHWQGRTLLDPNRPKRTYFFTPWGDLTFGFRDANLKYIFNATYNKLEIFDLENDPLETKDLSAVHPDRFAMAKARLAAWVQFQDRFVRARAAPTTRRAQARDEDAAPE